MDQAAGRGKPVFTQLNLLQPALASPKEHFAYGEHDLLSLVAAYSNGITRHHPFVEGKKRTAFIAAYTFLGINGLELTATEAEAVRFVEEGLSDRSVSEGEFADWLRSSCGSRREAGKTGRTKRTKQKRVQRRKLGGRTYSHNCPARHWCHL